MRWQKRTSTYELSDESYLVDWATNCVLLAETSVQRARRDLEEWQERAERAGFSAETRELGRTVLLRARDTAETQRRDEWDALRLARVRLAKAEAERIAALEAPRPGVFLRTAGGLLPRDIARDWFSEVGQHLEAVYQDPDGGSVRRQRLWLLSATLKLLPREWFFALYRQSARRG